MVDRRKIGDLIQYFKINNGFDQFGNLAQSPDYNRKFKTRSHNQNKKRERLHKKREGQIGKTSSRHYFFTNRVVENWNKLSHEVIDSRTVNQLKNRIKN